MFISFLLPSIPSLPQHPELANCSFVDHFRIKLLRFTGDYFICIVCLHGELRVWMATGKELLVRTERMFY